VNLGPTAGRPQAWFWAVSQGSRRLRAESLVRLAAGDTLVAHLDGHGAPSWLPGQPRISVLAPRNAAWTCSRRRVRVRAPGARNAESAISAWNGGLRRTSPQVTGLTNAESGQPERSQAWRLHHHHFGCVWPAVLGRFVLVDHVSGCL